MGNRKAHGRHLSAPAHAPAGTGPWKKSYDCSGAPNVITEIKMVAAWVVEIDGALDETQTQRLGIKIEIRLRIARDRGDVMDASAAHGNF